MRSIILFAAFFSVCSGCKKNITCTQAEVTIGALACKQAGVIIDGIKYATDDLPDEYKVEGKKICIEYSFWDDLKMCPCCGGKRVHVIRVH